jgi:hypothetical protein
MSKRPLLNGASFSPWQVLTSANAYYALSLVFTKKLPIYVNDPIPEVDMEEAVASGTNRVLALELYLKALLIGAGVHFPADHDLPTLYQRLPEYIRIEIEKEFSKKRAIADDPNVLAQGTHWFQLTQKPGQPIEKLTIPKPVDNTLAGLLERNRRAFMESRYLFDKAKFDESSVFVYEHLRLAILCSVLCTLLEESLQNRYQNYKRIFSFYPSGPWSARA